jgi:2-methylisocitrate lyase-like PEP mutase family enzyme
MFVKMGSVPQSNGERPVTAVQRLRNMLKDPEKFLACPGVYDGFTARIALREGVDCLYMVSLQHRHASLLIHIIPFTSS